jgi:peroxiredoxin
MILPRFGKWFWSQVVLAAFLVLTAPAFSVAAQNAAPATPPPPPAAVITNAVLIRLQEIVGKINAKLQAGKRTEAELADDMKILDAFIAERKSDKGEEMAQVVWMKVLLHLQVLDDLTKGREALVKLKTEFPGTHFGKQADLVLPQVERAEAMRAIQRTLVVGNPFPDFQEQDLDGKPISISRHKGKVVLVDFWATWCGPCLMELPYVMATYEKHHKNGFEIVGISFDQDLAHMKQFIAANKMTWQQFFDVGAGNKLALKYAVATIPATFLLDGRGIIIARDLRGEELEKAVAAALAKK